LPSVLPFVLKLPQNGRGEGMKTGELLEEYGVKLLKRYGQHFLSDERIASRIVTCVELTPTQKIIEIGPGSGVLTVELLKTGLTVDAYEIDRRMIPILEKRFSGHHNFRLHAMDFLKYEPSAEEASNDTILFGNLPYNLSVPILQKSLLMLKNVSVCVFMFQYEVAQRLCASPQTKEYGSLSILVQTLCDPSIAFKVSKSQFKPAPKVDSAIVILRRKPCLVDDTERDAFFTFVRRGFGKRRKTLRNNYEDGLRIVSMLEKLSKSPKSRAEELNVADWLALYDLWKRS
jgi:16S rRNA (adenine1518-N6/adenine1519-N6)-dimethyltransferase